MTDPIVFISRNRIKQGKAIEFRKHYQDSISATMIAKPGTFIQLAYENEEISEVSIIRIFPSAEALDLQIAGADIRSKKAYETIEPISIEIFGTPNPVTVEKMIKIAGSGVIVRISPQYIGGFIRNSETENVQATTDHGENDGTTSNIYPDD